MEADRLTEAEHNIGEGRKADVLDYVRERYELGNFAVTAGEVERHAEPEVHTS